MSSAAAPRNFGQSAKRFCGPPLDEHKQPAKQRRGHGVGHEALRGTPERKLRHVAPTALRAANARARGARAAPPRFMRRRRPRRGADADVDGAPVVCRGGVLARPSALVRLFFGRARAFSDADGWGCRRRPHRRGKKVEGKRGESPGGHSRVDRLMRSYEDRALLLAGAARRSVARRRSAPVARAACVGSESCRALCERGGAVGWIAQSKRTAERPRCIGIARWFV